jgi:hypothetical protein
MGSYRTSKRWTSRIFSPASAALAMFGTGSLLVAVQAALARPPATAARRRCWPPRWCSRPCTSSSTRCWCRPCSASSAASRFVQWLELISVFRWVGMAYAGSASVATLLFVTCANRAPAC